MYFMASIFKDAVCPGPASRCIGLQEPTRSIWGGAVHTLRVLVEESRWMQDFGLLAPGRRRGKSSLLVGIPLLVLAFAGPLAVCAQPSATTTVLAVSQNAVNLGTVVTLSATVTTIAAPVTVGQVQFLDGIRVLGVAQLTGAGVASLKTRSFTSGTHSLTAAYFGAPNSTQ